jgi:hypothetical protein
MNGIWRHTAGTLGHTAGTLGLTCVGLTCATLAIVLAPVASASAAPDSFTWAGTSEGAGESAAHWSHEENWQGGVAPTASEAIATLTFPHLSNSDCNATPPTDACYTGVNDISGLTTEAISLDDADDYFLLGEGIMLGSGGLTATPAAGASGSAGSFLLMPLHLSASQRWNVADRSGGEVGENGLLLGEEVTGSNSALTVALSNGPAFILGSNVEAGPVRLEGPNSGGEHIDNGLVELAGGQLNAIDREPVDVENLFFAGTGALGALSTNNATLHVGSDGEPTEGLEAASVNLNASSALLFEVVNSGTVAQTDYSQLVSVGPVELSGTIGVVVARPSAKAPCPTISAGTRYTFVSTAASLSGSFANAPEGGAEVPIDFIGCGSHTPQRMRIAYERAGAVKTVTGIVEAQVAEQQEHEAKEQEVKREEATRKLIEERAKKAGEEAATAALKKHQEEEAAAHGSVLGTTATGKIKPLTRAQLLARALKQCRKQPKRKRTKCEAAARKRYAPPKARGRKGAKK